MRHRVLAILLFVLPTSVLAQDECAWLPAKQVAEALPALGPWQTTSGGEVGSCQFLGRSRNGLTMLGFTQLVQDSEGKAKDFVVSMRRNLGSSHVSETLEGFAGEGFSYRAKDETADSAEKSLFLVGYEGRVVVMGTLTIPGDISTATRDAYLMLARSAFKLATDETGLDAATRCKYFEQSVLKRLFEGASFSQQVYGANSCIAFAGKRVLMLAIVDNADSSLAQAMAESGGCRTEPVPALGAQGSISHACTEGNPRATVRYMQGNQHFEFSWVPGREPGQSERDVLTKLALAARDGVQ